MTALVGSGLQPPGSQVDSPLLIHQRSRTWDETAEAPPESPQAKESLGEGWSTFSSATLDVSTLFVVPLDSSLLEALFDRPHVEVPKRPLKRPVLVQSRSST